MNFLLILAGIYGISGSLFKVMFSRLAYIVESSQEAHEKRGNEISRYSRIDIEGSRVLIDHYAFTLIGSGFVLGIIAELDRFQIDPVIVGPIVVVQSIFVWVTGYYIGPVNRSGRIFYKGSPSLILPTISFGVMPGLISWSLLGTHFIPITVPLWFIVVSWSLTVISILSLVSSSRFINNLSEIRKNQN